MSDKIWDEFDWERFLQEQDRRTEQYMNLLEKYLDHPQRDEMIAREMGWMHLEDPLLSEIEEDIGSLGNLATGGEEDDESPNGPDVSMALPEHSLHKSSLALTMTVNRLFEEFPELTQDAAAIRLGTSSALASAKLAAALCDDDIDEMGMTIAYLKRALKAVTMALEAVRELETTERIDSTWSHLLDRHVFDVRDRIISEMGQIRQAFRKRQGL